MSDLENDDEVEAKGSTFHCAACGEPIPGRLTICAWCALPPQKTGSDLTKIKAPKYSFTSGNSEIKNGKLRK